MSRIECLIRASAGHPGDDICVRWFELCDIVFRSDLGRHIKRLRHDIYSCLLPLLLDQRVLLGLSTSKVLERLRSVLDYIAEKASDPNSVKAALSDDKMVAFFLDFTKMVCNHLLQDLPAFWNTGPKALGEFFEVEIVERFNKLFPALSIVSSLAPSIGPPLPLLEREQVSALGYDLPSAAVANLVDSLLEELLSSVPSSEWWGDGRETQFCQVLQCLHVNAKLNILRKLTPRSRVIPLQKAGKEAYFESITSDPKVGVSIDDEQAPVYFRPPGIQDEEIAPLFTTDPPVLRILHVEVDKKLRPSTLEALASYDGPKKTFVQLSKVEMLDKVMGVVKDAKQHLQKENTELRSTNESLQSENEDLEEAKAAVDARLLIAQQEVIGLQRRLQVVEGRQPPPLLRLKISSTQVAVSVGAVMKAVAVAQAMEEEGMVTTWDMKETGMVPLTCVKKTKVSIVDMCT